MTAISNGGLDAPQSNSAIIVTESGLVVTFDTRTEEEYEQTRDVTEATLETGYKIADGIVTNQPEISFTGIITGVYQAGTTGQRVWDPVAAAAAVANLQAVFDSTEFCSAYTSFNANTNCQITSFNASTKTKQNAIEVKISLKSVKTVSFAYTKNAPPAKNKTGDGSASGKQSGGKQSTENTTQDQENEEEKESSLNAILF
ncbi:hypothetical protein H3Z28_002327 [Salmonella enterica subsp. enterica serovar Ank]|nr:hypothetical protein [Salmonella enterica subsp. enterica]EFX3898485.1 hypothetical protein [Salmonella enterica subsp. enterica serovar Ank]